MHNFPHKSEYLACFAVSTPQNMEISQIIGISMGRFTKKAKQKDFLHLKKRLRTLYNPRRDNLLAVICRTYLQTQDQTVNVSALNAASMVRR